MRWLFPSVALLGVVAAVAVAGVPVAAGDTTDRAVRDRRRGRDRKDADVTFWGAQWWKGERPI